MADANVYPPSPEFVQQANVKGMEGYRALYRTSRRKARGVLGRAGRTGAALVSRSGPTSSNGIRPSPSGSRAAKSTSRYNCIDRHLATHRKNKVAILWEGEPGDQRMISYQELHRLVCRFANVLKAPRPQGRRPRHRLHGHGPGTARRPAGLRAPRHHPQRRLRRLLRRGPQGAHSGPGSPAWSSPATARGGAAKRSA